MKKRTINKETNSYYTEEEMKYFHDLGFSWSNKSGDYDNCMYKYENGVSYDLEVRQNGFGIVRNYPNFLGYKQLWKYGLTIEELKDKLKLGIVDKISLNLYKLNAIIFGILWLVLFSIVLPFTSIKNKRKEYISRIKDVFKGDYFYLRDALPFVWGMNVLVIGILTTYLIMR
jgi:hypothetical protein